MNAPFCGSCGAERSRGAKSGSGCFVCRRVCEYNVRGGFIMRTSFNIPEGIHRKLRIRVAERGLNMSQVVTVLLTEWLENRLDVPELFSEEMKRELEEAKKK